MIRTYINTEYLYDKIIFDLNYSPEVNDSQGRKYFDKMYENLDKRSHDIFYAEIR